MSRLSVPGSIKSVQSGTIVIANNSSNGVKTNTATISGVDTSKSVLFNLGSYSDVAANASGAVGATVILTNSTTVTGTYRSVVSGAIAENMTVGYEVVEFQ